MKKHSKHCIRRQKLRNIRSRRKKQSANSDLIGLIRIPKIITLSKPALRNKFLSAIKTIGTRDKLNKKIFVNFKETETLYPDGAIYLLHQIDKVRNKHNLSGKVSDSPIVRAMLSKLGIHTILKLKTFKGSNIRIVNRWKILSGTTADLDEKYIEIENEISKIVPDRKSKFVLQNAISEAISNVINHAYDENSKSYKKWFLFFCVDEEKSNCTIVVSDLGKTIPATIPVTFNKDKFTLNLREIFFGKTDSELIEIATKMRRTSTEEYHRGKGFNDIIQVESFLKGAKVLVVSRRGAWSSEAGNMDFNSAIEGTTIGWEIPLDLHANSLKG